jgi:1-acyl-sn-glycerol-3-phosphate acyltransferase
MLRQWLGSIAFTLWLFASVPIYSLVVFACAFGSLETRFIGVTAWADATLYLLRVLCGLDYVVEGRENVPEQNCVVLMNHRSAWETIAQLQIFPIQTWVLKRELMWTPVLGWVLWLLNPIAIDRGARRVAVRHIIEQGRERLEQGLWVMIFPEGTRVRPGETRRYGLSGALLARESGRPVLPVAHDAGDYWPRRGWYKRPGTIRVVIGAPIDTEARDPREINDQVRAFVDATLARIREEARK